MASTINATPTSSGLIQTADNSGVLALQTGGTTAVTVNTSQQVGIGTTSPAYALDVNKGSLGSAARFGYSGGKYAYVYADSNQVYFGSDSACNNSWASNDTSSYLVSYTGGNERMRITSGGFVGIGEAPNTEAMLQIKATSSQKPQLQLVQDNATDGWNLNATSAGGQLNFQRKGSGGTNTVAYYDTAGSLILSGPTGQKSTGTTWSNPSDSRLKDNVTDYTKGLAELSQVNVKTWEYNGKAGTTAGSKGLGVIADEIMQVLPETVDTYEAKLNAEDEDVTDVKRFDATEITWLLVNAVKELNAKVDAQALEIQALKGTQL